MDEDLIWHYDHRSLLEWGGRKGRHVQLWLDIQTSRFVKLPQTRDRADGSAR
jgi:hypothetical protein